MFSDSHFDAPPPQSQFRRPWSPEVDVQHSSSLAFRRLQEAHLGRDGQRGDPLSRETSPPRRARREASDSSVEALDLADYARTLRLRQAEDPYPAFPSHIIPENHAPSSFPSLIPGASSIDYLPSLVSRGPTLSSSATHNTFTTTPRSSRRHFSLPPAPPVASYANSSRPYPNHGPYIRDQYEQAASTDEIDISRFPKWSRNWYDGDQSVRYVRTSLEPDADIYTPVPPSQFPTARTKKSMFDPGYMQDASDAFDPYDLRPPPFLSSAGHTSREMLAWKNDLSDPGPILDPMMKEERMRMLQKEFGTKANARGKTDGRGLVDEEGKPLIGTVDEQGQLVTVGPRRRVALKALQVLLATAACIPAIYAALVIKAKDPKNPPPPANKPATFILYILSSVSLLSLLYMFVFRPCCFVRPKSRNKHPLGGPPNLGMMVLPVGGGGGRKGKKPKAGKKQKGKWSTPGAQDVQVNLIVDPAAFQPPEASESESEEGEDEDAMPGAFGPYDGLQKQERHRKRRRQRRRRGVFEGLAMEEQWRVARAWTKKMAAVNAVGLVCWGAAFVFIMIGKRCPSGGFDGWCNAYNVSVASACLLAVSFGIGIFFSVQDLHSSKESPRTRV
ncbi:hypothetical protein HYPSUDRAFT_63266 [Hypholoma sublateritium FD-334 SS-4]|uniref:Uncharacterized protein n=1 Tax=Hypholoma sublateritium (strain FD-334 SS-4) TaxID=945553 RepID=A0A0D2MSL7_HYPSF|nr:hypothetical protein HYPSUDRAFT_63266 [Hypholoma sublateritium FD-334 SS-4]